ncbi:hypothetical protein DYB31_016733 [Aphanomyces astaci]|uniref:Uncharacterized protein n=1 Tax=Aphanomyces astaci TaxID=112090 RepID=A0A397EVD2_APHAT|nr:hypothetical protein DYB31_016733 [Aphanomyces astaci]
MHLMNKLNLRETSPLQAQHLIYVALQLLHRLPDELYFEIARHPFDAADTLASIMLSPPTLNVVLEKVNKLKKDKSVKKAAAAALDTKPPWKL